MPLVKAYTDDEDGYYYIEYGLSTATTDLEQERMSENALNSMVKQAPNINGFEAHMYGLNDVIGPVVKGWLDKKNVMWVKVRVIPRYKDLIKELVDAGVKLGGSIGGLYIKDHMEKGVRVIDELLLLDATLTPLPVNFDTLGTAREATKSCKNNMCKQIVKSIRDKYNLKQEGGQNVPTKEMKTKSLPKKDEESYEYLVQMVKRAIRAKYSNNEQGVWVKRTFPDSALTEIYQYKDWDIDGPIYDIPYEIDENGEVVLGDPIEADNQYVAKKIAELNVKQFEPIFKKLNKAGEDIMDKERKEELETFGKAMGETIAEKVNKSNEDLINGLKDVIGTKTEEPPVTKEEKPVETKTEEVPETKEVDEEEIVNKTAAVILKALGVDIPEETPDEDEKVMIIPMKQFNEMNQSNIKKAVVEIAKSSEAKRKSKSIAGNKFEIPEEKTVDETKTKRKSIRQMAEESVDKNPLPFINGRE